MRRVRAGADDLAGAGEVGREIRNDDRVMLDRPLLMRNIFAVRIARQPLVIGEQPDVDAEFAKQVDTALRHGRRDQVLFDRLQLRIDNRTAVEGADRQVDRQRFDQEVHADGRAAGDDGEADPCRAQLAHRGFRVRGKQLVLGHERAVDIGNNKGNAGHNAGHGRSSFNWLTMSSTMVSTDASIDTVMGRSLATGGSSVWNWLVSNPGGMK